MIKSYKDMEVWQDAMQLVTCIYKHSKLFPDDEKYGLVSQVRRAAVSVPSNIAEGSARANTKELLQFINIAYGSLAEVETQLMIAGNLSYLEETAVSELLEKSASIGRQLNGLRRTLKEKLQQSRPSTTDHRPPINA